MSFWKSDTRVAYAQHSIAIPAENGKQFNENAKIVIVVPPDVVEPACRFEEKLSSSAPIHPAPTHDDPDRHHRHCHE